MHAGSKNGLWNKFRWIPIFFRFGVVNSLESLYKWSYNWVSWTTAIARLGVNCCRFSSSGDQICYALVIQSFGKMIACSIDFTPSTATPQSRSLQTSPHQGYLEMANFASACCSNRGVELLKVQPPPNKRSPTVDSWLGIRDLADFLYQYL